jgi:alpha-mannosidase
MDERIIIKKLQILQGLATEQSLCVSPWEARTALHQGPEQYEYLEDWHTVPDTSRWPAGVTVFLRAKAQVPPDWDPDCAFLRFGIDDLEGLLTLNGKPWAGVDRQHGRCPVPVGQGLDLLLEFDSVPRVRYEPGLSGKTSSFSGAHLVQVNPELEAAYWDLRFAYETFVAITDERRKALLGSALEEAFLAFRLTGDREQILAEVAQARELLAKRVGNISPDPEGGHIFLTGHTHVDVAYLWPIKETIRKCARTFSTACWMMERYPEYRFSCSQPQLYAFTKRYYPELYARIGKLVAEGRWETTGGMWVEADCNVTSGESLIRQILYGLRFWKEEFGTRPTVCWLPDVFGYNAGLPQILAGCGIDNFWTWKLHWQSRNPFPHHLFWWEGVDGSRVLAHIPKLGGGAYNGSPTPQQLAEAWRTYLEKEAYPDELFPFGYGDGGGGVNEEQMEFAVRACEGLQPGDQGSASAAGFPGLPACRLGTSEEFFAETRTASPTLPTWVGELYLETHRATYTTQGQIKRANRRCEMALRSAEMSAAVARRLGVPVDLSPLHDAWEKVLLMQFHDILPGSSVGETYEEARQAHTEALQAAISLGTQAIRPIIGDADDTLRYGVLNSLSWERDGVVELLVPDIGDDLSAVFGGRPVPVQIIGRRGDQLMILVAAEGTPPAGGAVLELETGFAETSKVTASGHVLANDFFRVEVNAEGEITSLWDKRAGREVVAEGQSVNQLQLFQDGPERESAWNVHTTSTQRRYDWDPGTEVKVTETGPVRATIQVTRTHGDTKLVQDISLYHHIPWIEFRTRVNWRERQTMLKAAFPLAIHTDKATYEIQFGAVERPTHRNTSWDEEKFEVCAQRWADMSEGGYGVSLLNDCKYGHDALGNVLRLTLLRGSEYPDPKADLGEHEFAYALYPHEGDWRQARTPQRGWELNVPLFSIPTDIQRPPTSFLQVEGPAILETWKPAEDGDGDILRLYEPYGSRGEVTVHITKVPVREVVACNLIEENAESVPMEDGVFQFAIKPFQIRTFRIR